MAEIMKFSQETEETFRNRSSHINQRVGSVCFQSALFLVYLPLEERLAQELGGRTGLIGPNSLGATCE